MDKPITKPVKRRQLFKTRRQWARRRIALYVFLGIYAFFIIKALEAHTLNVIQNDSQMTELIYMQIMSRIPSYSCHMSGGKWEYAGFKTTFGRAPDETFYRCSLKQDFVPWTTEPDDSGQVI